VPGLETPTRPAPDGPPARPEVRAQRGGPLAAALGMAVLVAGVSAAVSLLTRAGAPPPAPPPLRPSARDGGTMAYDPATRTVLLYGGLAFGGSTGQEALGDTWVWDGERWTELHPRSSPPPLTGALMAWDPASRRLVLTGGQTTSPLGVIQPSSETWTWDGSRWSQQVDGDLPASAGPATLATDGSDGELVLVTARPACRGFRTWVWGDGTWEVPVRTGAVQPGGATTGAAGPAAPSGSALGMGYDPLERQLLLVTDPTTCPAAATTATPPASGAAAASVWGWGGTTWWPEGTAAPPAAGVITTSASGLILVSPAGTYVWRGTWAPVGPAPGVLDASVAYDAARGDVVLFSGVCIACAGSSLLEDTWTWPSSQAGGLSWALRDGPPLQPPGTSSPCPVLGVSQRCGFASPAPGG
jgi:hypothetical protein